MNSNTKTLVGTLIVAVALFAGWALLGGQYRMIGVLKAAIAERDGIIIEREGIIKNLDTLYGQYQQREQEIRRFESVMPSEGNIAGIISALDAISRQAGLQLTGIAVQGGSGGDKQTSGVLTIPIQLLGSYEALAAFLSGIEQNLRLLDVISVNISPDPTNSALLHFDLQVTAYFVK